MKTARLFLAGMYLHLALSVAVPVGIPLLAGQGDGWNGLCTGLLLLYLTAVLLVQLAGWACALSARRAAKRGEEDLLRTWWLFLKLCSIPFYILNVLWSLFVWGLFLLASRGILLALLPVSFAVTCLMAVPTGLVGLSYLRLQKRQGRPVSGLHTVCQLLPVLDVISTLLLVRRLRHSPYPPH